MVPHAAIVASYAACVRAAVDPLVMDLDALAPKMRVDTVRLRAMADRAGAAFLAMMPVAGTTLHSVLWTKRLLTQVGGVLVLYYQTPTMTQTFTNQLYFGITWLDRNDIQFSDGAGHYDTLTRQ